MGLVRKWRAVAGLFTIATVIHAVRSSKSHGTFMGVPFEFRPPTARRVKERWWNPADRRVFTPHVFGVGWSLNLHRLFRRGGNNRALETEVERRPSGEGFSQ